MAITSAHRSRDQVGAAGIEFMIVALVMLILVLVGLCYGYTIALRHALTQAATEGARAGAVSPDAEPGDRVAAALDAVNQTLSTSTFELTCGGTAPGSELVRDDVVVGECGIVTGPCPEDRTSECVTVSFDYDYAEHPAGPDVPGSGSFLPDHIRHQTTTPVS